MPDAKNADSLRWVIDLVHHAVYTRPHSIKTLMTLELGGTTESRVDRQRVNYARYAALTSGGSDLISLAADSATTSV